jgi:hypothetical protein
VPNVVFEDVKAIQRIEGSIRKIGIRAVKAITTAAPELDSTDYNRIWLCLPRNRIAQRRLACYQGRCCFELKKNHHGRFDILWKQPSGKLVRVCSPLAQYLRQRAPAGRNSPWRNEFANIVARDFAVISRFKQTGGAGDRAVSKHPFWEYFIFGIRGLGTWGAGWFIYHKADLLADIVEEQGDGDVQILLEVTYHHHHIISVVDVSRQTPKYFQEQCAPRYIAGVIRDHPS